jgi:hypothetical protein
MRTTRPPLSPRVARRVGLDEVADGGPFPPPEAVVAEPFVPSHLDEGHEGEREVRVVVVPATSHCPIPTVVKRESIGPRAPAARTTGGRCGRRVLARAAYGAPMALMQSITPCASALSVCATAGSTFGLAAPASGFSVLW